MEEKMNVQDQGTLKQASQAHLQNLLNSYMKSYSVKAAIELGIADVIHSHGQPLTASQLAAKIPISSSVDVLRLDRLMRLLVHTGVFAEEKRMAGEKGEEVLYGLTPVSRLMLRDSPVSMSPLAMLSLHPLYVSAWDNLAAWFRSTEGYPTAFEAKHGEPLWVKASNYPALNKLFNESMSNLSKLLMGSMIERCGEVFKGVSSLVDVGGGDGTVAGLIADAFPHIKCMVLELPHVVGSSSLQLPNVVAIGGDMFESVPPADAVLLKAIMHNWDDDKCVKILTRCKEAIPNPGGKVLIVDIVSKKWADQVFNEMQLNHDLIMTVFFDGKERNEEDWKKLIIEAGFSSYKIVTTVGVYSLIEVFP
ncbi:probable O-methyltransferase 3 [Nymphaea colorata]|nr:probable O-methyltransferase 3 [Nymphaea colorata]